ncbi:MAG: tetratricopeptide repeat protein [Myxococcota bacterium]
MLRGASLLLLLLSAPTAWAHVGLDVEIAEIGQRLEMSPDDPGLLLRRAELYRLQGKPELSLVDLDHAQAVVPGHRSLLLERGLALAAQHEHARAERDLDAFLASGPGTRDAHVARAEIRAADGRADDAVADYTTAIALRPQEPDLHLARARLLEGAGRWDEAEAAYRQAMGELAGAVVIRRAYVELLVKRQKHAEAVALIDAILPRVPVKADWYLRRAEILEAAGQPRAAHRDRMTALRELNALLARRPDALRRVSRARAYLALGRREEARADLEAALKSSPRLEPARKLLGSLGGTNPKGTPG